MNMWRKACGVMLVLMAGMAVAEDDPPALKDQRARVHAELAFSYLQINNLNAALEEAETAKNAYPEISVGYHALGVVYMALDEPELAERNFNQALKLEPKNSEYNNNYGWFVCQRNPAKSLDYMLMAARDPLYKFPDLAYYRAGVCARKAGDLAAADAHFLRALKRNPEMIPAMYELAQLRYLSKDFDTVSELLQKMQEANIQAPELLWLAARTYRQMGRQDAVDSTSAQLQKLFPKSREAELLRRGAWDE